METKREKKVRVAATSSSSAAGRSSGGASGVEKAKERNKAMRKRAAVESPSDERETKKPRVGQTKSKSSLSSSSKGKITALEPQWDAASVLSTSFHVSKESCQNFVNLLEADCTLPFIARYRREAVGNVEVETLQQMKQTLGQLEEVKKKMNSVLKALQAQKQLTPDIQAVITSSTSTEEIAHWYAPFKVTKKSNVSKAKDLGLEEVATKILNGSEPIVSLRSFVRPEVKDLQDEEAVMQWINYIIVDLIAKNKDSIAQIKSMIEKCDARICCSKSRSANKQTQANILKFQDYVDFNKPVSCVKPHQVLAINRGEDLKILSVKILIPSYLAKEWSSFGAAKFLDSGARGLRREIIWKAISDAYHRTVEPYAVRRIRSSLNEAATKASIQVFSSNLRQMLLLPPLRGCSVLGLDPGFKNGCKCALISATGSVMKTAVIHPKFESSSPDEAAVVLRKMLQESQCSTVALGNGTACRETEGHLSRLIQAGYFRPLDIVYTIVNETGASIYSCTPEAKKDHPNLDPNIISAVSIAKRLQDPLAELLRVSARHLGVGMYQHDIPPVKLEAALDDVVVECVSFVGVDLNTCPLHLLSQVAGIGDAKAKHIVQWRDENGPFVCRQQLLEVKSIGPKTFEQCAGFLRIIPVTANSKTKREKSARFVPNPLDRTCVHPESYETAKRIVQLSQGRLEDVGFPPFISCLEKFLRLTPLEKLGSIVNVPLPKLQQIVESLLQPIEHDLRQQFEKPLFRRGLTSLDDLNVGTELTGKVMNVTHFGAFVDVGVGTDALLHISQMKGRNKEVGIGARVQVRVSNVDKTRQRLGVSLI